MGFEVMSKVEESLNWFNKGWILAARYSEGSIMSMGVPSKSTHFRFKISFGSTLMGWKIVIGCLPRG